MNQQNKLEIELLRTYTNYIKS